MIEKETVVGPFQCNCRLLICPKTREAALIDPGDDADSILEMIGKAGPVRLKFLLHTHAHLDHFGATRAVHEGIARGDPGDPLIALHPADQPLWRALREQGKMFGLELDDPLPVEKLLADEEELAIGDLKLRVLHTPGHSPGSVCFLLGDSGEQRVYSGDTLFQGSVGRTDLWGGDQDLLFRSIRERLLTLDDDTRVCPGHGPDSSIGRERRANPFIA